jgi:hypothetical protein
MGVFKEYSCKTKKYGALEDDWRLKKSSKYQQ